VLVEGVTTSRESGDGLPVERETTRRDIGDRQPVKETEDVRDMGDSGASVWADALADDQSHG